MVAVAERPRPDALMEEAHRRARRRRIAYVSATLALAAGGAVFLGLQIGGGGGGSAGGAAPRGFHLVPAQGPVAHAVMHVRWRAGPRTIDLGTGGFVPAPVSREIWWDRKSGLARVVERVDGKLRSDVVGQTCGATIPSTGKRSCFAPTPFALLPGEQGLALYGLPERGKKVGSGQFDGRRVTWFEHRASGCRCFDRVGVSVRTGMPIVRRSYVAGALLGEQANRFERTLPSRDVTFVVPQGGVSGTCFPPCTAGSAEIEQTSLTTARHALGRPPLWLGPNASGHRLWRTVVGVTAFKTQRGARLLPAKFVRFDYGFVSVKEFVTRPFWYRSGPALGKAVLEKGGQLSLNRDGLLVIITRRDQSFHLTPKRALELVRTLRPLMP